MGGHKRQLSSPWDRDKADNSRTGVHPLVAFGAWGSSADSILLSLGWSPWNGLPKFFFFHF